MIRYRGSTKAGANAVAIMNNGEIRSGYEELYEKSPGSFTHQGRSNDKHYIQHESRLIHRNK